MNAFNTNKKEIGYIARELLIHYMGNLLKFQSEAGDEQLRSLLNLAGTANITESNDTALSLLYTKTPSNDLIEVIDQFLQTAALVRDDSYCTDRIKGYLRNYRNPEVLVPFSINTMDPVVVDILDQSPALREVLPFLPTGVSFDNMRDILNMVSENYSDVEVYHAKFGNACVTRHGEHGHYTLIEAAWQLIAVALTPMYRLSLATQISNREQALLNFIAHSPVYADLDSRVALSSAELAKALCFVDAAIAVAAGVGFADITKRGTLLEQRDIEVSLAREKSQQALNMAIDGASDVQGEVTEQ